MGYDCCYECVNVHIHLIAIEFTNQHTEQSRVNQIESFISQFMKSHRHWDFNGLIFIE